MSEKEIREAILFTKAPKRIERLGTNFTKRIEGLDSGSYEMLMRDIKMQVNRKRCSAPGRKN